MRSPEVSVVSLDGLNNNGKTTQVRYLQNELVARGVSVIVRRGDGSRKGTGSSESDPVSEWWQENFKRINAAGLEGPEAEAAAAFASQRLLHELYELKTKEYPTELEAGNKDKGVVLLDRGPISRLFVARRYDPEVTFEDAFGLEDNLQLEEVIPDDVLVLHTSKETLLARNDARQEGQAKRDFNRYIISRYYETFERVLDDLPPLLAERTTIIDSGMPIEEVGRAALSVVVDRL